MKGDKRMGIIFLMRDDINIRRKRAGGQPSGKRAE